MRIVELFEVYAGKTFARLYERFPLSTEIKVEELVQGVEAGDFDKNAQMNIAGHTLMWLQSAGYLEPVRKDETHPPFRGTLTAKGFECLQALPLPRTEGQQSQAVPAVPSQVKGLGSQLVEAIGEGTKAAATDTVKTLVGKVLAHGIALSVSYVQAAIK